MNLLSLLEEIQSLSAVAEDLHATMLAILVAEQGHWNWTDEIPRLSINVQLAQADLRYDLVEASEAAASVAIETEREGSECSQTGEKDVEEIRRAGE